MMTVSKPGVFQQITGQQGKTMGTAKATKAADKSQVCRKLVTALHKLYGKSVPGIELSVVETMLFAACLEDNSLAQAELSLKKLLSSYFDLNEIRVSSVSELEKTLAPLDFADWKGLRIRSILRFVFETTYSYDYEKLRRQTLEQAVKTLKKVNDITPFIRDFILHEILGSHVVCLDNSMLKAARWLGLVPADADLHDASDFLKGGVKKSEVSEFCHLLRCLATDPKFVPRFDDAPESELSMDDVQDRLVELQSPPKRKAAKPAEPAKADKKTAARKAEASDDKPAAPAKKSKSRSAGSPKSGQGTPSRASSGKTTAKSKTAAGKVAADVSKKAGAAKQAGEKKTATGKTSPKKPRK